MRFTDDILFFALLLLYMPGLGVTDAIARQSAHDQKITQIDKGSTLEGMFVQDTLADQQQRFVDRPKMPLEIPLPKKQKKDKNLDGRFKYDFEAKEIRYDMFKPSNYAKVVDNNFGYTLD